MLQTLERRGKYIGAILFDEHTPINILEKIIIVIFQTYINLIYKWW